jgi:hypothetical protein
MILAVLVNRRSNTSAEDLLEQAISGAASSMISLEWSGYFGIDTEPASQVRIEKWNS